MQTVNITGSVFKKSYEKNEKYEVCRLVLITNRYNGKGKEDTPDFHDCAIFGSRAKSVHENLDEKDKFEVRGTLKYRITEYKDKKFKQASIVVDDFDYHSSKKIKEMLKNS